MPPRGALKARLDGLYDACGADRLEIDPIRYPRAYDGAADREIAGFIAAALAYGRVAHIRKSVATVLDRLGPHPAAAVLALRADSTANAFRGFTHRFNTGRDVADMLVILKRLLERHGSLEAAFLQGFDAAQPDVGHAIAAFSARALAIHREETSGRRRSGSRAGVRFFFSSPGDGSACKRMNMFLRWMVRRDHVDLGLWSGVPPSKLVMPLDTHTARICRELRLSARRSADWRMAIEVTEGLRALDPDDPVRYDFALFNLGLRTAGSVGAL
ncbi:MAG: TIGR02757 family protein [Acidobacteria bacterium]|nr:TIGR02757 family protein [Acidobacteriota bacterium]